jgi:hypothetical protein
MMTDVRPVPYQPPCIAERTTLEGALTVITSGEVAPSATFRPI